MTSIILADVSPADGSTMWNPASSVRRPWKSACPGLASLVTIGIIAAHVLLFILVARYFPIFEHRPEGADDTMPGHLRKAAPEAVPETVTTGT